MNSVSEPIGTLDVALGHAARLLQRDPKLAVEQADEILKAVPGHPHARLILGTAQRHAGDTTAAVNVLEPLAREQPNSAPVHIELAVALSEAGRVTESISAVRRALQLQPNSVDAWRVLAEQLDLVGDADAADRARAAHLRAATKDPRLLGAAAALVANELAVAEALLRTHLRSFPTDVAALRMLGEAAVRLKRYPEAQQLLERCIELAPSFDGARHNYAVVLNREGKPAQALPQVEHLLKKEPRNLSYRSLKAAILANAGDYAESIGVYEAVLKDYPEHAKIWMSYGHSLKTQRRQSESIAAYRRSIELEPSLGEVYWSLANLKTFRFTKQEVAAMRDVLMRQDLSDEDRLHFAFALGKALEDEGRYEESFAQYVQGNAIRKRLHPYSHEDTTKFVQRSKAVFTQQFFASRAGVGCDAPDPIFIVGLPRAGSTLIEQILSSHSAVEGTMELPDMPRIAAEIFRRESPADEVGFAHAVAALTPGELRDLGERYMADTRSQRKTARAFFIDKMPNNFLYAGLMHLMLPNAKIIDARRHPLGGCLSGFKQHFARGQSYTYGLEDIGRYYRDYVELMAHMDAALPGRVHRVFYEAMVEDTETEVRRLLDYCGLPFEDGCLKFYDNERAVRTASSEQVRQPIYRQGVDQWRHFEPWLGPLKATLGEVLEHYPAVPTFANSAT
ncbi:MAG: sulfotransferase [Pseudomonadota bacterium]|nr:sulfotransferase [Pseudomonadota bacterium]